MFSPAARSSIMYSNQKKPSLIESKDTKTDGDPTKKKRKTKIIKKKVRRIVKKKVLRPSNTQKSMSNSTDNSAKFGVNKFKEYDLTVNVIKIEYHQGRDTLHHTLDLEDDGYKPKLFISLQIDDDAKGKCHVVLLSNSNSTHTKIVYLYIYQ